MPICAPPPFPCRLRPPTLDKRHCNCMHARAQSTPCENSHTTRKETSTSAVHRRENLLKNGRDGVTVGRVSEVRRTEGMEGVRESERYRERASEGESE